MKCDIVVGQNYGDEAKGKVTYQLLKNKSYTYSVRFNGSNNAGHTIYHYGEKIVTHLIPAGVFFGVPSIIGPGCVINVKSFLEEVEYLRSKHIGLISYNHGGPTTDTLDSLIKIADTAHIITEEHLAEDSSEVKIGTTRRGVGPAYRDKYARTGIQAKQVPELSKYLVDFHQEIFSSPDNTLILEGAQGFYLDPHFGDYPYVTSSHGTVAGALLNGIPHKSIRDVYGVCKAYDTYVGAKKFQPEGNIFNQMRDVGQEFGATTGRPRQCNYLNINALKKATQVNAVDILIVNKMDVLKQIDTWKVIVNNSVVDWKTEENFKNFIQEIFKDVKVSFSYSPEEI